MVAVWAGLLGSPETVHDRLEDGRERGDPDPGGDEDGMTSAKNVARRGAKRTVDVNV